MGAALTKEIAKVTECAWAITALVSLTAEETENCKQHLLEQNLHSLVERLNRFSQLEKD